MFLQNYDPLIFKNLTEGITSDTQLNNNNENNKIPSETSSNTENLPAIILSKLSKLTESVNQNVEFIHKKMVTQIIALFFNYVIFLNKITNGIRK